MKIHEQIENKRAYGYRVPGGKYIIGGAYAKSCAKFPVPLEPCPHCGASVKFSRGFQYIDGDMFAATSGFCPLSESDCEICFPICGQLEQLGLMWVSKKFYPTPADFNREAIAIGICKRIASIPRDFQIGKDWIALAHLEACKGNSKRRPGIFTVFKPTHLEYIFSGKETDKELETLHKKGFKLINVIPAEKMQMSID